MILTCAHKSGRVRAPPLICSTHCPHPLSWNKHWITHERYHSSLSGVLIWTNRTIHRMSGIATVDWRKEEIQSCPVLVCTEPRHLILWYSNSYSQIPLYLGTFNSHKLLLELNLASAFKTINLWVCSIPGIKFK